MSLLKAIKDAYTKDNGELSLISVMVTVLMLMFIFLFVKAEVFGYRFSSAMLEAVVSMVQIGLGAVGVGYAGSRVFPGVRDLVNEARKGPSPKPAGPEEKPTERKPAQSSEPAPRKHALNSLATWARQYIGIKEIPGSAVNPTIQRWIDSLGWSRTYLFKDDDEPWCSLFPNAGAKELGLEYSNSPAAKSWLKVGRSVPFNELSSVPEESGLVAVYHRNYVTKNPSEGSGHVVIVTGFLPNGKFLGIGGNESNQVSKETTRSIEDPMFIDFRLIEPIK